MARRPPGMRPRAPDDSRSSGRRGMIRRLLDIAVSAFGLVLTSPLLVLAMLAVRLESPGPVIYRQRRVGLHGQPFEVLKLRTMVDGAEHQGAGLAINAND